MRFVLQQAQHVPHSLDGGNAESPPSIPRTDAIRWRLRGNDQPILSVAYKTYRAKPLIPFCESISTEEPATLFVGYRRDIGNSGASIQNSREWNHRVLVKRCEAEERKLGRITKDSQTYR